MKLKFKTSFTFDYIVDTSWEVSNITGYVSINHINIFECKVPSSLADSPRSDELISEYIGEKFAERLNEILHP